MYEDCTPHYCLHCLHCLQCLHYLQYLRYHCLHYPPCFRDLPALTPLPATLSSLSLLSAYPLHHSYHKNKHAGDGMTSVFCHHLQSTHECDGNGMPYKPHTTGLFLWVILTLFQGRKVVAFDRCQKSSNMHHATAVFLSGLASQYCCQLRIIVLASGYKK